MYRSLWCGQTYLVNNFFKNVKLLKLHKEWNNVYGKIFHRQIQTKNDGNLKTKCSRFAEFMDFRKSEAKRSLIVQVQSAQSFKELYAYCSQFGTINQMFHYTSGVEPLHFIVVEFANETDVTNVLNTSCHIYDNQAVPVKSPFLWFRVSSKKSTLNSLMNSKPVKLDLENGNKLPSNESITELTRNCNNISEQMRVLYELTKLSDLGVRLRFLSARQIEIAVTGMFPEATAYPFGSSINGYGKIGCDLDLILKLDQVKENPESRLVYQCKAGLGSERSQSQRHMEAIGDILHLFLPGCSQVRRILQARVPILKYYQQFTDVECDLSMTNITALHMSEILYMFGSIDDRVRPLVFTIRKWADEASLTNSSPGRWITNFSLTLLVLAFLQRIPGSHPILPSLNKIFPSKGATSSEDTYLPFQDLTRFKNINTDKLETLLFKFFEYYSNFDFSTKAISLNESSIITKPENNALYIVNPLERALNVSKNVSLEELERLKIELRNAAWSLESQEKKTGKWGIQSIFTNRTQRNVYIPATQYNRMMEVKNLFEEPETIEYKSEAVKKEIDNIKSKTEKQIEEIANNNKIKVLPKRRSANLKRR